MSERHEAAVTIACIQTEPAVGEKNANLDKSIGMIEEAAGNGARLVVLPELCNSGYVFESRSEAFELAEPVPDGPTVRAWSEVARRHGLHLVAGISERAGDALYNSAVVIGPHGYVGSLRKVHLWNEENLYFEPGDTGFPVFKTPIGRIGTFICYDCWFPESFRLCALQGADIVCVPTDWVPIPGQDEEREAMANILCMAAAHSNSIFIAAADRIGTERILSLQALLEQRFVMEHQQALGDVHPAVGTGPMPIRWFSKAAWWIMDSAMPLASTG